MSVKRFLGWSLPDFYHVARSPVTLNEPIIPSFGNTPDDLRIYAWLASIWEQPYKSTALAAAVGMGQVPPMYVKEHALESVRRERYRLRPSRFASVFVFRSLDDAIEFRAAGEKRTGLYRCIVQGGRLTSLDMRLSGPLPDDSLSMESQLAELRVRAIRYWRGETTDEPCMETLVAGGIVIPVELLLR